MKTNPISRWLHPLGRAVAVVAAGSALALGAAAQELSFYYPVAVGGPVTKIIDGLAADFEKENPGIKIKPVYSGSYQDTITKVLTAAKGGDAPHLAAILSTDMFTLIDERRGRALRRNRHQRRRQGLDGRLLPRLHEKQPDRWQDLGHPVPALDGGHVLEQATVQGSRAQPRAAAPELGRAGGLRQEADPA